jgi:hypothetical protein
MPPLTLPTGTVSPEGRGDHTYPRSPGSDESESALDELTDPRRSTRQSDRRSHVGRGTSSEGEVTVSELRRRNAALRDELDRRDRDLQRVIDHYEDLLARRSPTGSGRRRTGSRGADESLTDRLTDLVPTDALDRLVARFSGN